MTGLIESVARAICKEEYGDENAGWENQIPAARAAIEAVKGCAEVFGKFCYARNDDAWWIDDFCENALGDYLEEALKEQTP